MQSTKSCHMFLAVAVVALIILPNTKAQPFSSPPQCNFETWGTAATDLSTAIARDVSPATVGHQKLYLVDPNRDDRPVTTDIWYPAVDNGETLTRYNPLLPPVGDYFKALDSPVVAQGNFPLLVFSHGSNGIAYQSATLMEHLASWGFVVAAPSHAGNCYDCEDPDNPIPFTTKDRPMDVSFVIDSLLDAPQDFSIDASLVGVLGNSYGGLTSLIVNSGFEDYPRDTRVKAIMPISPSINFFPEDSSICSNIEVPMLLMGGEKDTTTPITNNDLIFNESMNSFPRWHAVVQNAGHTSFSDTCILFDIILNNFAGGNTDMAYSLMGAGDLEAGKSRIEEAFCETTLLDTLPLMDFSAVAFFRSFLLNDSIARQCLDDLYSAQRPPLSYVFQVINNETGVIGGGNMLGEEDKEETPVEGGEKEEDEEEGLDFTPCFLCPAGEGFENPDAELDFSSFGYGIFTCDELLKIGLSGMFGGQPIGAMCDALLMVAPDFVTPICGACVVSVTDSGDANIPEESLSDTEDEEESFVEEPQGEDEDEEEGSIAGDPQEEEDEDPLDESALAFDSAAFPSFMGGPKAVITALVIGVGALVR